MADRLTQLQEAVNHQADNLCNSIGIIQQISGDNDHTKLFSQLIARTAKDIEVLIESLPSEDSTSSLQAASIALLEGESELVEQELNRSVLEGEELLKVLQYALRDIANTQMEIDRLAAVDEIKVSSDNFALQ
ncbi:mediator of RNA polymerase II transcription subunit 21 [Eurytemora carolleeae]|uniref:mediator of RNA polymerase II transcription subunit 21 n=1 Tax=Eurytemora carolleeae TaxID=1294199 RepID=UPI000C77E411|nr:mediator of RNA polymerase II transcription subunit 21 [Eurytemora carolleeae]|eukprot:XP_023335533.1 mediator of RNA polymerase II transcription subunit 21-like [Eurytemora affinis]